MTPPHDSKRTDHAAATRLPVLLAVMAVVVAVRWMMVAWFGSDMPFWDQWDAEVDHLYRPYLEGRLRFLDLFAPHNEHRIFFTRLLGLALFTANSNQFDNNVECLAGAFVYAAALSVFAWPLLRRVERAHVATVAFGLLGMGALPYAWENLTAGLQNSFFFVDAFAIGALSTLCFARSVGLGTQLRCALLALCACFSLGSGCVIAPVLILLAVQRYRTGSMTQRQLASLAWMLGVLTVFGIFLVPTPVAVQSSSVGDLLSRTVSSASAALAWPFPYGWMSVALLWWPSLVWLRRLIRSREIPALDLFLLAVAAWTFTQALAIAVARGLTSSRYDDILIFGGASNVVLGLRIATGSARSAIAVRTFATIVLAGYVLAVGAWSMHGIAWLKHHADGQKASSEHVRHYLAGAGREEFNGVEARSISYPNAERVMNLLDVEAVKKLLPASVALPLLVSWPNCALLSSPGVAVEIPAMLSARGSFGPTTEKSNVGRCTSRPFASPRPYLRFLVVGNFEREGLRLVVQQDGLAERRVPIPPAAAAWVPTSVAAIGDDLSLVATDSDTESWFAFTAPVSQGRLSAWAERGLALLRLPFAL